MSLKAPADREHRWRRALILAFVAGWVLVSAGYALFNQGAGLAAGAIVVVLGAVMSIAAYRPTRRSAQVAAVLVCALAPIFALDAPLGLAWAEPLPLFGAVLLTRWYRGRTIGFVFVTCWIVGASAVAIAATMGPAHATIGRTFLPTAVGAIGLVTALTYGVLWWVARHWWLAVDEAEAATIRFRALIEQATDGILVLDRDGRIEGTNPVVERILGRPAGELVGLDPAAFIAPDRLETSPLPDLATLQPGQSLLAVQAIAAAAGAQLTFEFRVTAMPDGRFLVIARDITERMRAELDLRRSEAKYRTVLEQSPIPIAAHRAGRGVFANEAHRRMFGYSSHEEVTRLDMDDMVAPESRAVVQDMISRRSRGLPAVSEYEFVALRRDGSTFPVSVKWAPIELPDGPATLLFHIDLTEAKRAMEALRSSEEKFSKAFRDAPVLIGLTDMETDVFIDVNDEALRASGFSRDEVIGHTGPEIGWTTAEDRNLLRSVVRTEGRITGIEMTFCAKDGRQITALLSGERILISGRDCLLTTAVDISARKEAEAERARLEARLAQAAKMESIGELAGGIAHDFNNMLTAIRGYTELVRRRLPEDLVSEAADLDETMRVTDRAAELTRQMLAFARKTVLEPRVLDPALIVARFAPMARRLLGEHIEVILQLGPDTGRVRVDPAQLEQVLLNLAVNARDAMPGGGRLTIETSDVTLHAILAAGQPDRRPGDFVALKVSDSGAGMDDETQARIFEPFFTTKEVGKGTGMGLATVMGIVKMSDGWIELQSAPGKGTTFTLFFPRVEGEALAETSPVPDEMPSGSATVLFVEDDPSVRSFGTRCLRDLGYTVLEASNGADAVSIAAQQAGPIDLVVSDIVMPGLQGPDTAERIIGLRPNVRVLLVSGFAERVQPIAGPGPGFTYLEKPYSRQTLSRAVHDALSGPGAHP